MGSTGGKDRVTKTLGGMSQDRLDRYVRWQETIAGLGQIALVATNWQELADQAVVRLAGTLQIDCVEILELEATEKWLIPCAGFGWNKAATLKENSPASAGSQAGFTLIAREPVVVSDLATEKRFAKSPRLTEQGVVSGITVVIGGKPRPYGVLGAYARNRRDFAQDEVRFLRTVANVLAAAARGFELDQAQRDSAARVFAVVNTLVDGIITIDERGIIESLNPAAEKIFGYQAEEVVGRNVRQLMPQPFQHEHDGYLLNYLRTGKRRIIGIGREVTGLRKDSTLFPMDLAVSELQLRGKRMFTGVVRDITERRRMEREIIEAGAQEQRRIGQDLHDGLCQHLAGIAFATEVLRQKLSARSAPEAATIQKIGEMIDQSITQARDLARGLQPVTLDAEGLVAALKALVEKVEEMFHVSCLFVCDGPCPVADNNVATHLFRIAQEAISNAVKHGKARTIIVDLGLSDDGLRLAVTDDGVGLGAMAGKTSGMGLRTMDYRARVIGGSLLVQEGDKSGTEVVCQVRSKQATGEVSERFGDGKKERTGGKSKSKSAGRGRSPHR
jgi:PAS domain S-box-containing protein